jgi:hypothetical protein
VDLGTVNFQGIAQGVDADGIEIEAVLKPIYTKEVKQAIIKEIKPIVKQDLQPIIKKKLFQLFKLKSSQ